jgi:hypothetical protein
MGFGWLARGLGFERRHGPFIHERGGGVMHFGNRLCYRNGHPPAASDKVAANRSIPKLEETT